jgi:hypothetical protein
MLATDRNSTLFKTHNPDFTREDFYTRSLAVKGILHSFIDEYVHFNKLEDHQRINSVLELTLSLFNVPDEQIQDTIRTTEAIIRSQIKNLRAQIPA